MISKLDSNDEVFKSRNHRNVLISLSKLPTFSNLNSILRYILRSTICLKGINL